MSAPKKNGSFFAGPYRGLEPFDEDAAAFFFGREREAQLIEASLFAAPLSLLYGASGVGKSSVLRAGLLPRLRKRGEVLPVVFPRFATGDKGGLRLERGWQSDPVGGIKETAALALYATAGDDPGKRAQYQDAILSLEMSPLGEFFDGISEVTELRLMVILDQFEEYSLYHPEDELFAEQFPRAIAAASSSVSFLLSLREDALAKLDRFKESIPTLWDSYRRIDHLDRAAAEDAIRLPLGEYNRRQSPKKTKMKIENRLIEAVLRDVQTENVQFEDTGAATLGSEGTGPSRIETPYLQLVMTRLWEREQEEKSKVLRFSTLQSEGGAAQIVHTHLDRVMKQFSEVQQDIAANIFHRLVTPSGTKIAFSARDLAEYEGIDEDQLAPILRRLEEGDRRILRRVAARSDASDDARYEIFHDRLGKAILSWRTKRLKVLAEEKAQREDAERKQVAEAQRAEFRSVVHTAMSTLDEEGKAVWASVMVLLITPSGARMTQTARDLASHSHQPAAAVDRVLEHLLEHRILRLAYGANEKRFEIADDARAAALLDWHTDYIRKRTQKTASGHDLAAQAAQKSVPKGAGATDTFPFGIFRRMIRERQVMPFLGAGVALSARPGDWRPEDSGGKKFLPSNYELKRILAYRCDFPESEFEASDIAEVASYFAYKAGRQFLDKFLEKEMGKPDYVPSETHRFLAEEAASTPIVILTTNFDTLMEQALDERGIPYDVISYLSSRESETAGHVHFLPAGASEPSVVGSLADLINHERTVVVRLHGRTVKQGRQFSSYVLTEEDQIDWLFDLHGSREGLSNVVDYYLSRFSLLSLGQSARDWSQRALLRLMSNRTRRMTRRAWAVALTPSPLSIMTWQRYDVKFFSIDLNEWVARMREATPQ